MGVQWYGVGILCCIAYQFLAFASHPHKLHEVPFPQANIILNFRFANKMLKESLCLAVIADSSKLEYNGFFEY